MGAAGPQGTATLDAEHTAVESVRLAVWAGHGRLPLENGERSRGGPGPEPRHAFLARDGWMVCQYSRAGPVSSEKHQVMPGPEVEGGCQSAYLRNSGWRSLVALQGYSAVEFGEFAQTA